jgi:hypothetical protein
MIDAAVIQLRMLLEHTDGIPENVKASGTAFVNDLDTWSESMKKPKTATAS